MTVYQFICVKDIEVEGRLVRDVTLMKATFRTSSLKDESYPTPELIRNMINRETEFVRSHFKKKPMTHIEESFEELGG